MGRGEAETTGFLERGSDEIGWAVARLLDAEEKFLVLGHTSPDADCLAAALSLASFLRSQGKDAIAFAAGQEPLPERLSFLGTEAFTRELPSDFSDRVVVVVDCALLANTGISAELPAARGVVQIDHHVRDNERFGQLNFLVDASSASELVVTIIERIAHLRRQKLGFALDEVPSIDQLVDPQTATALYAGIVSDTGRFRYDNTSPKTLRVAAKLLEAGVDLGEVTEALYQETPFKKTKLVGQALASAELHADGTVMICKITQEDFRRLGAHENDGSRMIDQLRGTEGVKVVCLVMERESRRQTGTFRVSLRSQPDGPDVSETARIFGGGGHRGAASFLVSMPLEEIEQKLVSALT